MAAPTTGTFLYVTKVVHDYLCSHSIHTEVHPLGVLDDTDIRVSTEVPASRPVKLVTITTASTSGGDNIALSHRRVIIQCCAPAEPATETPYKPAVSAEEATSNQAETVHAHMRAARYTPFETRMPTSAHPEGELRLGTWIRDVVTVGTPARFDDPDDSTPRFQMTLDVLLRAHFP